MGPKKNPAMEDFEGPCPAGEPSPGVTDSTEEQVASFLLSKGIKLDCDTVEVCHPLPRKKR